MDKDNDHLSEFPHSLSDWGSPCQGKTSRPPTQEASEMVVRPGDLLGAREEEQEEEVDSLAGDRQGRLAELQGDQDVKTETFSEAQIRSFITIENQKQV